MIVGANGRTFEATETLKGLLWALVTCPIEATAVKELGPELSWGVTNDHTPSGAETETVPSLIRPL